MAGLALALPCALLLVLEREQAPMMNADPSRAQVVCEQLCLETRPARRKATTEPFATTNGPFGEP